ncbi:uncharacterized protein [Ambystoma mexicanum]|uniref:uncharacterized protein n=1 Tax=Ambystoma mexicanum TaxID=8296 RepID=UPI0037E7688F
MAAIRRDLGHTFLASTVEQGALQLFRKIVSPNALPIFQVVAEEIQRGGCKPLLVWVKKRKDKLEEIACMEELLISNPGRVKEKKTRRSPDGGLLATNILTHTAVAATLKSSSAEYAEHEHQDWTRLLTRIQLEENIHSALKLNCESSTSAEGDDAVDTEEEEEEELVHQSTSGGWGSFHHANPQVLQVIISCAPGSSDSFDSADSDAEPEVDDLQRVNVSAPMGRTDGAVESAVVQQDSQVWSVVCPMSTMVMAAITLFHELVSGSGTELQCRVADLQPMTGDRSNGPGPLHHPAVGSPHMVDVCMLERQYWINKCCVPLSGMVMC